MSVRCWLVAAAAGIGGFLVLRSLLEVDQGGPMDLRPGLRPEAPVRKTGDFPPHTAAEAAEERTMNIILTRPGLLQTEIYLELKEFDRKVLQDLLLRLDRSGLVRRQPEKSTYRVFPA